VQALIFATWEEQGSLGKWASGDNHADFVDFAGYSYITGMPRPINDSNRLRLQILELGCQALNHAVH
jgi:hypothetical protein